LGPSSLVSIIGAIFGKLKQLDAETVAKKTEFSGVFLTPENII
jgi:hypothetical protein